MALPKINLPISELTLPSNGAKIKYRPFTVKEEKILLVAQESGETENEVLAMKQIINNCMIDYDISDIALFDFEYIYLTLRSRSVDNMAKFVIKDPDTQENVELELDMTDVDIYREEGHSNEIKVNDDYTLFLRYPNVDNFIRIVSSSEDDPLVNYFVMVSCLDSLASEDEVHDFKEYSEEEVEEFMDGLSGDVIRQITTFFETMPKIRKEIPYTNSKGKEQTFVVEGTRSFFI
tara:strand:+ start:6983 stop:7684 length:702 start_codon:yes stop_codon:yes gene_type:complete